MNTRDVRLSEDQLRILNDALATHVLNNGASASDIREARNMSTMIDDLLKEPATMDGLNDFYEGGLFVDDDFSRDNAQDPHDGDDPAPM